MTVIHTARQQSLPLGNPRLTSKPSSDGEGEAVLTVEIAERGGAALQRKAAGRYYTPESIGRPMARALARRAKLPQGSTRLVDPFGGDGRLLVWFLQEAAHRLRGLDVEVELWDLDGPAVATAVQALEAEGRRLGLRLAVIGRSTDSFVHAVDLANDFDVVITNPPWERLKPDPRELDSLPQADRDSYVSAIREADRRLERVWPVSQPTRKWGGWGTNLSRVGMEATHWICRPGGTMGIVLPSSFLADSTSVPLRRMVLSQSALHEVSFYPAEMRAWDGADVDSVTMVAAKTPTQSQAFLLRQVDRSTQRTTQGEVALTTPWLMDHEWAVPVTIPPRTLRIIETMADLPQLGSAIVTNKPLRLGRELDESGHHEWTNEQGSVPFIKGRDIEYMHVAGPSLYLADPDRAKNKSSTRYCRFVWRDVSRPSQARRLIPAVLGPGPVTGNSVGVGWVANGASALWATAIAGLLASVVLESQARALLATSHMSKSVVSKLRLPLGWIERAERLVPLATELRINGPFAHANLEVAVGRLFAMDLEDWFAVADAVPAADDRLREAVASRW